jgi:hypothetical protein
MLVEGEHCLKAWHSRKGVLWGFRFAGMDHLEEAREAAGADTVLCLPRGALQEIFYHAQVAVHASDDYDKQLYDLLTAGREALNQAAIWHPAKPFQLNLPPYERITKRFRQLWPDGTTLGFVLLDEGRVHTSALLGKDHGEIHLFTTLDAFGFSEQGLDLRTGPRTVAEMTARRFAPLHTALFMELAAWREMTAGPRPLTYLRLAERRGRAVMYPKPFGLRLALWAARAFRGM